LRTLLTCSWIFFWSTTQSFPVETHIKIVMFLFVLAISFNITTFGKTFLGKSFRTYQFFVFLSRFPILEIIVLSYFVINLIVHRLWFHIHVTNSCDQYQFRVFWKLIGLRFFFVLDFSLFFIMLMWGLMIKLSELSYSMFNKKVVLFFFKLF
jgi:hypothetical protein